MNVDANKDEASMMDFNKDVKKHLSTVVIKVKYRKKSMKQISTPKQEELLIKNVQLKIIKLNKFNAVYFKKRSSMELNNTKIRQ